ncbi:hypothetical protein G6L37_05460 [Agrobacterium rubi]|nr:hypothetical protein [Agrobacterium rubi]NTF24805.1 hypothetical protein [Agrobacterium rubi]
MRTVTAPLHYDEDGFADYHGLRVRRPSAGEAGWSLFSDIRLSRHLTEADAMREARTFRHAEIAEEMIHLEREGVDLGYGPSMETTLRCENYEDILRVVCSHLDLPQSESGPADDVRLYDQALEDADLYAKQADAELADNRSRRFAAEAALARLFEVLEPFVHTASKLPDPRNSIEGSTSWAIKEGEFVNAREGLGNNVFHRLLGEIRRIEKEFA